MNKLPLAKRVQILSMLCEGVSMRSISRIADVSINTVTKLLVDAGETCITIHDETVRNVKASRIQCDEIWSFNYCKQRTIATATAAPLDAGDVWTWTALDADTKLIVTYGVGDRTLASARKFIGDLKGRLANRVQLTSDGHRAYVEAVDEAFGDDVDFAQLVKLYGPSPAPAGRYSPAQCIGARMRRDGACTRGAGSVGKTTFKSPSATAAAFADCSSPANFKLRHHPISSALGIPAATRLRLRSLGAQASS